MKFFVMIALGMSLLFGAVDINTASENELSGLSGIGAVKAGVIVEYRKGKCFGSVDELTEVKGIGIKTVEKNRSNLTASECKS